MLPTLPAPRVLGCYFDDGFTPHLPAMRLHWDPEAAAPPEQTWDLPGGLSVLGPPPSRFGLSVHRYGADSYRVRLLWDQTGLTWNAVPRGEILTSSLAPLLAAMGTDLWYLLDQPVPSGPQDGPRAA